MNTAQWIGVAIAATQALIALSLLFLTLKIHRKETRLQEDWRQRDERWKEREEGWKEREAELAREIHSNDLQLQRTLKIQAWGNECICAFSEANHLCSSDSGQFSQSEYAKRRRELLVCLSSLIDKGRMFFKNESPELYGTEKPPAYRGFRPKIIDPLVAAYSAIEALELPNILPDYKRSKRLIDWRRYFVSVLQKETDTDWMRNAASYSTSAGGGAGSSIDENSKAPRDIE